MCRCDVEVGRFENAQAQAKESKGVRNQKLAAQRARPKSRVLKVRKYTCAATSKSSVGSQPVLPSGDKVRVRGELPFGRS